MPHVLFKLLQTVQHSLLQQLASPGCPSEAGVAGDWPQLLHTRPQPGQVAAKVLESDREAKGQKNNENGNGIRIRNQTLKSSICIFYFTTKGRRHSCCLLMVNKLSIGILVGPSRLQARDRKLSRASQITLDVSDQYGSNFSIIRTLAGCRRNDRDEWGKLPEFEDPPVLFLFSMDICQANTKTKKIRERGNVLKWKEWKRKTGSVTVLKGSGPSIQLEMQLVAKCLHASKHKFSVKSWSADYLSLITLGHLN